MTQEMLLITGPDDQEAGSLGEVIAAADTMGLNVCRLGSPEDAGRHLADAIAAGKEPALVAIGPALARPLSVAREVRRLAPVVQLVFLADENRAAELRREMGLAPRIGTYWTIAAPEGEGIERALREAARSTAQRRRMRTTLDRANVQLSARSAADAPDYRKLVLSDRYLASILASAEDAILSADTAARVMTWNRAAERLFGYAQPEAIGRPLAALLGGDDVISPNVLREAQTGRVEGPCSVVCRRSDGSAFDAEVTLAPVRDDIGRPLGLSAIIRDVTERKQAERALRESQGRFEAIFEQVTAGVVQTDLTGRFLLANKRYCEIVGRPIEELLTLRMQDITHPDDLPENLNHFHKLAEGGRAYALEKRYLRPDGSPIWVDTSVTTFRDAEGAPLVILGVAIDITARKEAEEELRKRVAQLAEEGRRKNEFLALLGHELRNPLAPLKNGLQILGGVACEDDRVERIRGMMDRQVRQLTRLVDDLLDVSRINRGLVQLRKERVDLATIVSRAVETTRPAIEERSHDLTVALPRDPLWLDGDPVRLEQILGNLLTNAARYTEPGGRISVLAEREGDRAVIRVRDNGIGIRPEMVSRIFEMFTQADRIPGRVHEGLGIGLTLVKSLAEMHGGTVEVISAGPGEGSELVIRLPAAEQEAGALVEEPKQGSQTSGRPLRILVVDDNEDAAETLSMLLTLFGHEVRTAHDGSAALGVAQAWVPEVAFLDIGLPNGMSGHDLARRMRASGRLSGVRLVALTGFGQEEDRRKSREAGFDHHLTKPADPDAIEGLLAFLMAPRAGGS